METIVSTIMTSILVNCGILKAHIQIPSTYSKEKIEFIVRFIVDFERYKINTYLTVLVVLLLNFFMDELNSN